MPFVDELEIEFGGEENNPLGLELEFNPPDAVLPAPPEPDPPPTIEWNDTEYVVSENLAAARLFFSLSTTHSVPVRVTVDLVTETPGVGVLVPGEDFVWNGPVEYVIPAGQTLGAGIIVLINDDVAEPSESHRFTLTAVEDDPQPGFDKGTEQDLQLVGEPNVRLTVAANDTPDAIVEFSQTGLRITEGETNSTISLILSEPLGFAIAVDLVQVSGDDVSDRLSWPISPTIEAGQTSVEVEIVATDNATVDGTQVIVLELQNPTTGVAIGGLDQLTVQILDPTTLPPPTLALSPSNVILTEGQFEDVTLVVTNAEEADLSESVTVSLSQFSGGAVLGQDFTLSTQTVTIDPFTSQKTFRVSAVDDLETESTESAVVLGSVTTANATFDSGGDRLGITVVDNDGGGSGDDVEVRVMYPSEVKKSGLGDDTVTLRLLLNTAASNPVTVSLRHYSPNAIAGTHYEAPPETVTFEPSETYKEVTFNVLAAGYATRTRWVVVELTSIAPAGQIADRSYRFVTVIRGLTDDYEAVPDEPALQAVDDFRLYNDRLDIMDTDGTTVLQSIATSTTTGSNTALAVAHTEAYARWLARNPDGVDWMDEGVPVVFRVMETLTWQLVLGRRQNGMQWRVGVGNPRPIRDVWFVGDGLTRQKCQAVALWYQSDGQPIPFDQVHFTNLEIVDADGQSQRAIKGVGNGGPGMEWHNGLIRVHNCLLRRTPDPVTTGSAGTGKTHGIRVTGRANYWVTDCEFWPFREHSFYVNQVLGFAVFARNNQPFGTGRTMTQWVSRFNENNRGVISHGLIAIADNVSNGLANPWDSGAKQHSVYVHFGHVVIQGNSYTGRLQLLGGAVNNRGGPAMIGNVSGDNFGTYIFQWPPFSGDFYTKLRVEIGDDNFDGSEDPTDQFNSNRMQIDGCYEVEIGSFTTDIPGIGQRPAIWFNENPVTTDDKGIGAPDGTDISGSGLVRSYNRPGGITFTGPPGPTNGQLLSYAGVGTSSSKYRHRNGPTASHGQGIGVQDDIVDFEANNIESYDGSNPS